MPERDQFIRSAWVVASLTGLSRVFGLLREIVLAYYFSTSGVLSAFRIAFMLPNLARRLFGEGALSAAMIPVLSETLRQEGEQASRRFVGRLMLAVTAFLVAAVLVLELVTLVWNGIRPDPALGLATILLPYMVMICLVALVGGVLNVRGRFAVPAAMPILLNLAIIGGAMIGARWGGDSETIHIRVICYAVLVAGLCQLALSALALRRALFAPLFSWSLRDAGLRKVAGLMGPMALGLSVVQINSLADYLIAYLFISDKGEPVGPAVLGYAQFLYQLPLGVFGIALATAIFPALAGRAAEDDEVGLARVFVQGLRLSLFVAAPASVGLMFIAHPLVATLFLRGHFDAAAGGRVAGALMYYSIGLVGYFSQHIIVRTFYARHDSRTPTRVALWMVSVNLAMNLVLVRVMEERGLALSTAFCSIVQVLWLIALMTRRVRSVDWLSLLRGLIPILIATTVMCACLAACCAPVIADIILPRTVFGWTALLVVVGVGSYGTAAVLLGIPELRALLSARSRS